MTVRPRAAPMAATDVERAVRYWQVACVLAAGHLFGLSWPPPGRAVRSRVVGHWGCNPGIAWAVGFLAAAWKGERPFLLVPGTGHATSFTVAHRAIAEQWDAEAVTAAAARYGQPGGDPSELLGQAVPYLGGELGLALGVSQGLAATLSGELVVCVVGDGECETPAALAAFAHRDVVVGPGCSWLPVVNANGARMGGRARFDARALVGLLRGMGYDVVTSSTDPATAAAAAEAAVARASAGERVAWVSATEKGWPAPHAWADVPFRGHVAHKVASVLALPDGVDRVRSWAGDFLPNDVLAPDGSVRDELAALARRLTFAVDRPARPPSAGTAGPTTAGGWAPPIRPVDTLLAARGAVAYVPDEAASNGMDACLASRCTREVLAEELCAAWTWGTVEAGAEAIFASYEAFAPLAGTALAQYAKLVDSRPPLGRPPFTVLLTSLGWANTPTHQNSDLVATVMARPTRRLRLLCPVGASSAARRVETVLDTLRDSVVVVVCSKQPLVDLPDPGTPAIEYRVKGAPEPRATVVAVGDVCVTEAVATMAFAHEHGIPLRVVAVVDVKGLAESGVSVAGDEPAVGVSWCAAALVAPALWESARRMFPVSGYAERWGPTPWETLRANGLDRASLLDIAVPLGLKRSVLDRLGNDLDERNAGSPRATVIPFAAPPLTACSLEAPR